MKEVYRASNGIEAHMLQHLLEQHGIEAIVLGEHLQSAAGPLPMSGLVRVSIVSDEQFVDARKIIEDWDSRNQIRAPSDQEQKTVDGGSRIAKLLFLVAGLLVGATVTYLYFHVPRYEDVVDLDSDGKFDEINHYAASGMLVRSEADSNHDGKIDSIAKYSEEGRPVSYDLDLDFDGVFDTHESFDPYGFTSKTATDSNGDGTDDQITIYEFGRPTLVQTFDPTTGHISSVVHSSAFKADTQEIDLNGDGQLDTKRYLDFRGEILKTEPIP